MLVSYHTHTIWSDGTADARAMLAAAGNAGLAEIGISDHYVMTPDVEECWSMPLDFLSEYTNELKDIADNTKTTKLKIGLEADYFPQTINALSSELSNYNFDYIIGSVHILDGFHLDDTAEKWMDLTQDDINTVWRNYYLTLAKMAATNLFDIVGHFDLCKKFAFYPSIDLSGEIDNALDAISDAGMTIEINTAGWDKPAASAYPEIDILMNANRRNIPIIISADAHATKEINRHYNKAIELAIKAGYKQQTIYTQREKIIVSLP
jgi:histidinol-phosphatase (PHP family)